MQKLIVKVQLKDKTKVRSGICYAEDRVLAKKGQLGDKLLCAPVKLNMDQHADSIETIERAAQHLQGGRNAYLSWITSYPPRVILSSRQIYDDIDRLLFYVSKFAYVTIPQVREFDKDGKRVRKEKSKRQENVDLRKQPLVIAIHIDTDNVHPHVGMSTVHPVYLQNIRINEGYYILAFAYARQEVLRERGLIAEDDLLYYVGQEDGRNIVKIDCKVMARREARAKETGIVEDLGEGRDVVLGDGLDENIDTVGLPPLDAVHHRHRQHPGNIFRALCEEYYPHGPKPLSEPAGITLAEQQDQNRRELNELLLKNNLGIKTGDRGGLVLIGNKEHSPMHPRNGRWTNAKWTKRTIEDLTGLSGQWMLGLPQEEQTFLAGKWQHTASIAEYVPNYSDICKTVQTEITLPWQEYRVKIKHIGGNSQRRMTLKEVNQLIKEYRTAVAEDRVVLGKPTTKMEKRLANIYLSPAMDDGWRSFTINGVKAAKLETALALEPNFVVREMRDGVEKFNVTFTMRYPVEQREAAINSISMVANDLVRVLEADGWTTSINAPGLPVVRGVGKVSSMPTVVGQPHARVSEPLQALLPTAYARLVALERADAVDRAAVLAKAAGLNPAEVVARMAKSSPLRPPLRQVVQCNSEALTLGQRLVPIPPQKQQQKTKEPEKVAKPPSPPQMPPQELQLNIDDEEAEKRRKRKMEEEEKKALLEAAKDKIYEK